MSEKSLDKFIPFDNETSKIRPDGNRRLKTMCINYSCCLNTQGQCTAPNPKTCILKNKFGSGSLKNERKFGWRGCSVVTFCPGCMTPLLTQKEAEEIANAFMSHNIERIHSIIRKNGLAAGFGVYVAGKEDLAQLLEHRIIVHPACYVCSVNFGLPEYEERCETNIIMSRRFLTKNRVKTNDAST